MKFTADVIHGQKTGFFLDQRDNRALVRRLSQGKRVLNLFSFNGGFSIAAGLGGASHVTSVDIAAPAIEAANLHWIGNGLAAESHQGIAADVFEFLESAQQSKRTWDMVICDPPSFAPSESTKATALAAYARLAQLAAKATGSSGLLALASCSSHIHHQDFLNCNAEAIGRARRKATLLADCGLPWIIQHLSPCPNYAILSSCYFASNSDSQVEPQRRLAGVWVCFKVCSQHQSHHILLPPACRVRLPCIPSFGHSFTLLSSLQRCWRLDYSSCYGRKTTCFAGRIWSRGASYLSIANTVHLSNEPTCS